MTPGQRPFTRRALLLGAGAAGVAAAYEGLRLVDDRAGGPAGGPGTPAPPPPDGGGGGATVDLTVRWRHLEPLAAVTGLVAGWQFDEGSGYRFADVSGNGHSVFVTGTSWNTTDSGLAGALHRAGLRGGAVFLDGSRWLEAPTSAGLAPTSGLTVSCRVRPDAPPTTSAVLVGYGDGYALTLEPDRSAAFTLTDALGSPRTVRSGSSRLPTGRWTQVTGTVSPATGDLRLYLDAVEVGHTLSRAFAMPTSQAHVVLGRGLVGALDEVAVQASALGADDVRHLDVVGLPRVFTQTSESIDADREVFSRFKGSEPVPHPRAASTVLSLRFADSTTTEQGTVPLGAPGEQTFMPGAFGGAWRATTGRLSYPSPLRGDSGTFETWLQPTTDPRDPRRQRRKEIFHAVGGASTLTLYTADGRWSVDVRRPGGRTDTVSAFAQDLVPGCLEHVAVAWGSQPAGPNGVTLYVDGVPAAFLGTDVGDTTYDGQVGVGGTASAPTYCLLVDARISDTALPWGEICPRGQAVTDAAGLDLRDRFDRPPGSAPMLWRPGSTGGSWSHRLTPWQTPGLVGDDPSSARALFQGAAVGLHSAYHPDAFGHASSIEAGVAFPLPVDGWAGLFVQSPVVGGDFSGVTFMVNPHRSALRLARYDGGRVVAFKVLPHDFPVTAETTYEMTLTSAGDGVVRGFLDGSNVISLRVGAGWPTQGHAGMVTDGAAAYFSNLHFCALTPATLTSRVVRSRVIPYGDGAQVAALELVPFRWHKRRGLLPWQYTSKDPEPAGNIAGAATLVPPRPIGPAAWRSEDSANSDLVVVNGRMLYFMRGNPRIDNRPSVARIGVLSREVVAFDGIHFTDPNTTAANLVGGTLLLSDPSRADADVLAPGSLQLNAPSTAYVGNGRLLFLGRESGLPEAGQVRLGSVVYTRFDARTNTWEHPEPQHLAWSPSTPPTGRQADSVLSGSPEVVSLRDPDHDSYQAVVFQQTGSPGHAVMAAALLNDVSTGAPTLAPGLPVHTSVSRLSGGSIYGFRVMFDNGIYYLHFNEGPQVPDWPSRFVLAATLDPYAGPWVANAASRLPGSTYFHRGEVFEPDNGAIWQGTMVKHRGRYYLYYENYHAVDDVDAQYESYANPQAGSRVGFATA